MGMSGKDPIQSAGVAILMRRGGQIREGALYFKTVPSLRGNGFERF
jgi:hypothetical protein